MRLRLVFLCAIIGCITLFVSGVAANNSVPVINITESTNPKIAELYQQLQSAKDKISNINNERVSALADNAAAMKEKEQSLENRTLTATTTAATGGGGAELAQGLAKQKSDTDAERDMRAYLATFSCDYGGGKTVRGGDTGIELPGANTLIPLYSEYKSLAESLSERKAALGLKPGIESEIVLDKTSLGLYDDKNIGITSGAYTSLYRAQMGNETDKAKIDADKENAANLVKGGAAALVSGVIGGAVGNITINKDAPKERSAEINSEYDKQMAQATAEQNDIEKQLNQAIADNATLVKEYNKKLKQHKDEIAKITQSAPESCRVVFDEYISAVSSLSPVENETDAVPDINLPESSELHSLSSECKKCDTKGGVFDSETKQCSCPADKPIEKNGKCVEKPVETSTVANDAKNSEKSEPGVKSDSSGTVSGHTDEQNSDKQQLDVQPIQQEKLEDETTNEESDAEYCPATGNRLRSINDKTKIGDNCSSTNIAAGEVVWADKSKKICTCVAYICNDGYHSVSGRCDKDVIQQPKCPRREYTSVPNINNKNDALKFCETKGGKNCKTVNAVRNYERVKGRILCNAGEEEFNAAKQRASDSKLKYYNCCDTRQIPNNISSKCKCANDFSYRVTPNEADGLMKEYALKRYKDNNIVCDAKSHRNQSDGARFRQCVSRTGNLYYEFPFKSLDNGNSGFTEALCSIWKLKSGMNLCKNATKPICTEISAAVGRLYIGGSAELKGTNCVISTHPNTESAPVALLNTKVLTKNDMRTVSNIDPLHFYDKKLQVNANSDIYKVIRDYLFNDLKLPKQQFSCSAGFVDNTSYYNGSRQQYNEMNEKQSKCIEDSQKFSGGGERGQISGGMVNSCRKQYPVNLQTGDLLTCEYNGKPVDFLFKKLDAIWNRKSTAGYQGLMCIAQGNGATFTGKSCTLADRKTCDRFKEQFKASYPETKGMEWDDELGCVLKDARYVSRVQKAAEVSGFVAVTLVSAVAGGPVVWALTAVESASLVTEAVTEGAISDWATKFLQDAAKCKDNSSCADAVLKKHIARIMGGSKYFNETQEKAVAQQTERLMGMLDESILNIIIEQGHAAGYIGEDREPDLQKAIRKHYNTQLTSQEKALLAAKKISTVLTFATVIGAGVTAGLRQAVKRNWIKISPTRQQKWLKWKILKPDDVAAVPQTAVKSETKSVESGVKPKETGGEPKPAETIKPTAPKVAEGTKPTVQSKELTEQEWRSLHEKYAPKNQSLSDFKESFTQAYGKDGDKIKQSLEANADLYDPKLANQRAGELWTEFHKKYDADDNSFLYDTYVILKEDAAANGIYKDSKIPGLESWSEQQLKDASEVYEAQRRVKSAEEGIGAYSTWNSDISKLKKELQNNDVYNASNADLLETNWQRISNSNLSTAEKDNILAYIRGNKYDEQMLVDSFGKDAEIADLSSKAKDGYRFLETRSANVRKIDDVAGLHRGSQENFIDDIKATGGKAIRPRNELIANFVSERVSLYQDIVTKNPSIYRRAKNWQQLSIADREKLCKEIYEMADAKLGIPHTEFGVKDLVKEFGKSVGTEGMDDAGNFYISSRHFPSMSFRRVMNVISHEQAHKVDKIAPNKGILGSQLSDLWSTEGYIQEYKGHLHEDYRLELTEQSSWQIGDAVEEAMSKLGL